MEGADIIGGILLWLCLLEFDATEFFEFISISVSIDGFFPRFELLLFDCVGDFVRSADIV